jgi:hypothetical protein
MFNTRSVVGTGEALDGARRPRSFGPPGGYVQNSRTESRHAATRSVS